MSKEVDKSARYKKRRWKPAFIASLKELGNVGKACQAAEVSRTWVYQARDMDTKFRIAWDNAIEEATDLLEFEARRRAIKGTVRPVFHKGKPCGGIREYSDTLLIFLLKGARPSRYRDNYEEKAEEEETDLEMDDAEFAPGTIPTVPQSDPVQGGTGGAAQRQDGTGEAVHRLPGQNGSEDKGSVEA